MVAAAWFVSSLLAKVSLVASYKLNSKVGWLIHERMHEAWLEESVSTGVLVGD